MTTSFKQVCSAAAMILLFAAAVDLLVVDFGWSFICDEEQDSSDSSTTSSPDDCFCCCAHVDVPAPIVLPPTQLLASDAPVPHLSAPSRQPSAVYHPPRA
jgi:hypothetical protein